MKQNKLTLAILDMYEGVPNQGMRCIADILAQFSEDIDYQVFDVRQKAEIPDLSFDLYVSSGGPGDPREGNGVWDKLWYNWLESVHQYNQNVENEQKKQVFMICHSFQMTCLHFGVGEISKRKSMSFGTFPSHLTAEGDKEVIFEPLQNPFYIADFRNFQVTKADAAHLNAHKISILAKEKSREHVPLARAIMAVRFSPDIIGTQFHPEADGDGMLVWFQQEEKKKQVIADHGIEKYEQMIADLSDPMKIEFTQNTILPTFFRECIALLKEDAIFA
jgi:GMP synthase-like glutamine amidotransferase